MVIKGNYWLDLIATEKEIAEEIKKTVVKFIGKQFSDRSDMNYRIRDAIRVRLENYGVSNRMGLFEIYYDIDYDYDYDYVLTGFGIKYVQIDYESW